MKRRTPNELFLDEKFIQYTKRNTLYNGGPTYFDILDKAQEKYEKAALHLRKPYRRYFYKVLSDTLELYRLALSAPTNDIIFFFFLKPFPKTKRIKLIRKLPNKQFWTHLLLLLDAFLDTFRNLPIQLRITTNMEESFHIRQYPISDTHFGNFFGTNGYLTGRTLCYSCGTAIYAIFK
ncbi:unnamed protein product [Rhizophagus irregularis]|nr:unnamed protein product [Rhizophagus irregularis]